MSNTEILLNEKLWIPAKSELGQQAQLDLQYTRPAQQKQTHTPIFKAYNVEGDYILAPRHYLRTEFLEGVTWVGPDNYPELKGTCYIEPFGKSEAERSIQEEAFKFLAESTGPTPCHDDAIVSLRCGGGKTCIGIKAAFDRGLHTLVVAHTTDILGGWAKNLRNLTSVKDYGTIISGSYDLKPITLALLPSLLALPSTALETLNRRFGTIIFDEAHHLSAEQFFIIGNAFSGRRIGLSATLAREDGMSFLFRWALGDRVFTRTIVRKKAEVYMKIVRVGDIWYDDNYARAVTSLAFSDDYIGQIVHDIRSSYKMGDKQLILASRKNILEALMARTSDLDPGLLTKDVKSKDRQLALRTKRVIYSVDHFGKEGLDEPSLTHLRVVTPVKDHNAVVQMVGRLERGDTVMQAFFYAADYVPFINTLHKAKSALVRNQYRVLEVR